MNSHSIGDTFVSTFVDNYGQLMSYVQIVWISVDTFVRTFVDNGQLMSHAQIE